jgi:hypothetical protein
MQQISFVEWAFGVLPIGERRSDLPSLGRNYKRSQYMKANEQKASSEPPPSKEATPSPRGDTMPPLKPFAAGEASIPEIVDRLEDLVNFAIECEGKSMREDLSFVEVYKRLQEVRKAIDFLNKDQNDLLALLTNLGGTPPDPRTAELSPEDKKLIDKLSHLKLVCEAAKERIHSRTQVSPEVAKIVEEKIEQAVVSEKKKISRRKGKFRPMGGKEGWVRT